MKDNINQLGQRLSPADLVALLTALNDSAAVSMTDARGVILYANEFFVKTSQYSLEELIGKTHSVLKSGFHAEEYYRDMWNTIRAGKTWRGEMKNRAKDGTFYWVDTSITPILDDDGSIMRYISVRFPITERKVAERNVAKIARDLEKYKLALDSTADEVVITDNNGIILYANAAVQLLTGFSPREIIGKKVGTLDTWGGFMGEDFYRDMWHTIKTEKRTFSGEMKNRHRDGREYVGYVSIAPVLDEKGEVEFFVSIERDVTKLKEVDRVKSEFVSIASHQLLTPIGSMNWNIEMLLDGDVGVVSDAQRVYLEKIHASGRRLVALVHALLNVSRLDMGTFVIEPEFSDVVVLTRGVAEEMAQIIAERNVNLEQVYSHNIPLVSVGPRLMRIILQNLLSNAVKYSTSGGKIILSLRVVKRSEMAGDKKSQGDALFLSVSDTGYGIPIKQQEKIFSKFYRADNARVHDPNGTGLGLYIVKSVVEHAGGQVWFESEENKGSTFYVLFPLQGMKRKRGSKQLDEK